jgi:cellulose 1,4-beta-cellobiosidase
VLIVALLLGGVSAARAAWGIGLASGSSGQASAASGPSSPTGVTSACTSALGTTVKVSWNPVATATSYTVWKSTTSATSGYTVAAAGVSGSPWTSGSLTTGTYWFEVSAFRGTNWTSANSSATASRTILVAACN